MTERVKSDRELAVLERLRGVCAALSEVEEAVDGFGHTSFRVRNKPFVMMGSSGLHLAIKTDPTTQGILVRTGRFERTPFLGQHGWISVASFEDVDWAEIEQLVEDGWVLAAPKRLAREWEAREEPS